MVILGHMPLLTRPEHIVHFFRDVHGTSPITKEALRQRTNEYHRWVDAFARKQDIPAEWAQKGVRKETTSARRCTGWNANSGSVCTSS